MNKLAATAATALALATGLVAGVGCDTSEPQSKSETKPTRPDPYAQNKPPAEPMLTYGQSWTSPGGYTVKVDAGVAETPEDPDAPELETWDEWQQEWADSGMPETQFDRSKTTPVEVEVTLVNNTGGVMDVSLFAPQVFTENMTMPREIIYPRNSTVTKLPDGNTLEQRWV